jgi:hypothetical protein
MHRARVLIADDHQILAEGVRGLLQFEFEVIGVVSDGRELLAAAKQHRLDVWKFSGCGARQNWSNIPSGTASSRCDASDGHAPIRRWGIA